MQLTAKFFEELTAKELYEILKARAEIFIMEQSINYQDMDDIDYRSLHCFYMENNKVVAYLRAFPEKDCVDAVRIGRVLTLKHGSGMGRRLMEESMVQIKDKMNCKRIVMDAQTHTIGFYEKFGFEVTSEEFWEEGILHVAMERCIF